MAGRSTSNQPFEASGALPDPSRLKQYEEILPGLATEIVESFKKESEHRREQERKKLEAEITLKRTGQVFGFVIAISAIIGGTIAASHDAPLAGGAIGEGEYLLSLCPPFLLASLASPNPRSQTSRN